MAIRDMPGGPDFDDTNGGPVNESTAAQISSLISQAKGEAGGVLADMSEQIKAARWDRGALGDRHLDSVVEPGAYWQSTAAKATTAQGYPVAGGIGVLTVTQAASNVFAQEFAQIGLQGHVEVWRRTVAVGGTATAWKPVDAPPIRLTTTEDDNFNTLEPGMFYIPFGSHAATLGLPVADHGLLIVHHYGDKSGCAWFFPKAGAGIWRSAKNNGAWGAWANYIPDTSAMIRVERLVTSTSAPLDFKALKTGEFQVTRAADAQALGLPTDGHGVLSVQRWTTSGGSQGMATWTTRPFPNVPPTVWATSISDDGTAEGWERVTPDPEAPAPAVTTDPAIRHQHIATRHAARIGAPIETGNAVPLAFVWDDYPSAMRDKGVIAAARKHGIPLGFAVCSRSLTDRAEKLGGVGITWDEIDAWAADGTVEIINHGATHDYRITDPHDEIVTGLEELRAHCPSADIQCWAMPTNGWSGFEEGKTADAWASTTGQLILAHHAYSTGRDPVLQDRTRPMTGTPVQGHDRVWVEAVGMTMAQRKALVTRLYGTGRGQVISAHAEWIGKEGRWTEADVDAFFAWLRAEEDAGRIRLMHLSRWAWAKAAPAS